MAALDTIFTLTGVVELIARQRYFSMRDQAEWEAKLAADPSDENLAALASYMGITAARFERIRDNVDLTKLKERLAADLLEPIEDGDVMVAELATACRAVEAQARQMIGAGTKDGAALKTRMQNFGAAMARAKSDIGTRKPVERL